MIPGVVGGTCQGARHETHAQQAVVVDLLEIAWPHGVRMQQDQCDVVAVAGQGDRQRQFDGCPLFQAEVGEDPKLGCHCETLGIALAFMDQRLHGQPEQAAFGADGPGIIVLDGPAIDERAGQIAKTAKDESGLDPFRHSDPLDSEIALG